MFKCVMTTMAADLGNRPLAYRTEQTYIHWVKRFIYFHGKQHPKDMGMAEVEAFLNHIAVDRNFSVSTQRIALNALIYLYKRVMGVDVGQLEFSPAQAHRRLPVVYSREQQQRIRASGQGK